MIVTSDHTRPASGLPPSAPDADLQPAAVPADARADARPWMTPLARSRVLERGLDLGAVVPGDDGAVRAAHVDAIDTTAQAVGSSEPSAPMTAGQLRLFVTDIDVTALANALHTKGVGFGTREGVTPTLFDLVAHAVVRSLRHNPGLHADDIASPVHLAVLTPEERWLELLEADLLSLGGLIRAAAAAATPSASAADQAFALLDAGAEGVALELSTPPAGARAALSVGRARREVCVVEIEGMESISIRSRIRLGLVVDAARVSRADAAGFLRDLEHRLSGPDAAAGL
jgi:pyruvate/2-oxoglutarate dehydrogenase complex dihydrolipoamide acyltransferase (E2) component